MTAADLTAELLVVEVQLPTGRISRLEALDRCEAPDTNAAETVAPAPSERAATGIHEV